MKIGFVGLGIMGSRMALNLIKAGHEVYLFNRSISKAKNLEEKGGIFCRSKKEVAENTSLVFTMVSTPEAVQDVMEGDEDGLFRHMKEHDLWVNCSTVNPSFTKKMAEKAGEKRIRFLDAPVAGSLIPAEKGELVFLLGGEEKDIREIDSLLDIMGKKNIHTGPVPGGSALKMVVNLLLGHSLAAFLEGYTLGKSLGLDGEFLLDTLPGLPVTAPFVKAKIEKIRKLDMEPEFPLQWMHKDLALAALSAYENNVSLPVTNSVKELYALAKKMGLGEKDMSAVLEVLD